VPAPGVENLEEVYVGEGGILDETARGHLLHTCSTVRSGCR
jgi:hypothetical protein